jgi:hypothetical protein
MISLPNKTVANKPLLFNELDINYPTETIV